jgi:hypothetical protein
MSLVKLIKSVEPSSPATDKVVVYYDTADGVLKQKNAAGVVTPLTTSALLSQANTWTANQKISKTRPELQLLGATGTSMGRFLSATPGGVALTTNVSYDGTNWNLDDTSATGTLILLPSTGGVNVYGFTAGTNPRTAVLLGSFDTAGNFLAAGTMSSQASFFGGPGRSQLWANSEQYALQLGYNAAQKPTSGMYLGMQAEAAGSGSGKFVISNTPGAAILRLDQAGILELITGQLKFPATQNPSSDVNTLDDYEEGTWTPIDASGAGLTFTYAGGPSRYIKIGRQVTFHGNLSYPATANATPALLGGLPFSAHATMDGSVVYRYPAITGVEPPKTFIRASSANIQPYKTSGAQYTNAELSSTTHYFSGFYEAAS